MLATEGIDLAIRQTLVRLLPQWRISGSYGDRLYAIRPYALHVPRATRLMVEYLKTVFKGGFS